MPKKNSGLRFSEIPAVLQPLLLNVHRKSARNEQQRIKANRTIEAGTDSTPTMVEEKDYYTALEDYLSIKRLSTPSVNAHNGNNSNSAAMEDTKSVQNNDKDCISTWSIPSADFTQLKSYHLQHILRINWLFDHQAHAQHCYYPSNVFPLGSNEEYVFFTRAWMRNVNFLYTKRLYERGGCFDNVLRQVPRKICPCTFLMAFNVINTDVWQCQESCTKDPPKLSRISVENELLFRSDFFNKRNPTKLYINTNQWVYETFVRSHQAASSQGEVPAACFEGWNDRVNASGNEIPITENWFSNTSPDTPDIVLRIGNEENKKEERTSNLMSLAVSRVHKKGFFETSGRSSNDCGDEGYDYIGQDNMSKSLKSDNDDARFDFIRKSSPEPLSLPSERQSRMSGILNSLYFGNRFVEENDPEGFDDHILARCEDYRSFLYSPLLKAHSCKHEDETITFVQRRSGDEIATELRKCNACGRVRAM